MELKQKYASKIIERGEEYLNSVSYGLKINDTIYGRVHGSRNYKTEVDLNSLNGRCSCPYGINCKHAVTLYLTYKKGKFFDAEDFIKSLDTMSNDELKKLILSKLQDNPDWIKKHNLRKSTNKNNFLVSFKKNFSSELMSEAEAILPDLSFEQLLELNDYISKNYEELSEKLLEETENDSYDYDYEYEDDYDKGLHELNEAITDAIIKRALPENKVEKILKNIYVREAIIENAKNFADYKEKIKKIFKKDECLKFLMNLDKQVASEIKNYIEESNKMILYNALAEKTSLIKEIAKSINDKTLLFSVALYEKDLYGIISNFDQFENAINNYHDLINYLEEVVELLYKHKVKNEEIAKKMINRRIGGKYNKQQVNYLAYQINDFEFIKKIFRKDNIEIDVVLLERLADMDKEKTLIFIKNKKDLLNRHWSDIITLFNFFKKFYPKQVIKDYVKENKDVFRTSSHLKKHLKEECGIFISQREGNLIVEI